MFNEVASQNASAVNATGFSITDCLFYKAGRIGGPGAAYIDLEPNQASDKMEDFLVNNNIIDARGAANPGNGIIVQAGGGVPDIGPGTVSNNTIIGGLIAPQGNVTELSNGIYIVAFRDLTVSGNTMQRTGQAGIGIINSSRITVTGNSLIKPGASGPGSGFPLINCTDCNISNNSIICPDGEAGTVDNRITESGTSDFNYFCNNYLTQYAGLYSDSGFDPGIVLVGANSQAVNNKLAKYNVGNGNIPNIAALRVVAKPVNAEAVTIDVNGGSVSGDGGGGNYYWDSASTATDDGILVVKGTNNAGSGRWRRSQSLLHLTTTARTGLSTGSGDAGLMVYDTTLGKLTFWDGSAWQVVTSV
jgi:parallel beta-helix repeat protein